MKKEPMVCPICERLTPVCYQEKHHILPRAKGGKESVLVCCDCGDTIHELFSNSEIKYQLNSIDKIRGHPRIQKWIEWAQKRPEQFGFCMRRKKRK